MNDPLDTPDTIAGAYRTKIERVRGLDGAPRHLFLWDVTAIGGSKRVVGCGTVRTKHDALRKARETIERAERPRLIRARLLEALRKLPLAADAGHAEGFGANDLNGG